MNVKELFSKVDGGEFVREYFMYCPEIPLALYKAENPAEKKEKILNRIKGDLEAFLAMEAVQSDKTLYVTGYYSTLGNQMEVAAIAVGDEAKDAFSIEFTPYTEVLGMQVSEASLNVYGELKTACAIMYAMTMFDEEQRKAICDELAEATKQADTGMSKPISEIFKDWKSPSLLDVKLIELESEINVAMLDLLIKADRGSLE